MESFKISHFNLITRITTIIIIIITKISQFKIPKYIKGKNYIDLCNMSIEELENILNDIQKLNKRKTMKHIQTFNIDHISDIKTYIDNLIF